MKKILLFILLFTFSLSPLFGQTYDLQFVPVNNDGTNLDILVQIRGSSQFKLGASNIVIGYSGSDISNPILLTAHNFNGFDVGPPVSIYGAMTVNESVPSSEATLSIVFSQTDEQYATYVPTDWIDIATVRFDTDDPNGSANLSYLFSTTTKTVIYKVNGTGGTFTTTLLTVSSSDPN